MSHQRIPLRSRSSLANYSLSTGTTPSQQTSKPRVSLTDIRRPPSSRSFRPSSPAYSNTATNRSRPGSAIGNISGSRPSTPSLVRNQEPYTGTITVSIRPNPYTVNRSQSSPWKIEEERNTIHNTADGSSFHFDNVFPPDTSLINKDVYNKSCARLVHSFLTEGFNGTVFAYGMTGSGKTFSMKGNEQDPGFVELAIDDIFSRVENDSISKQYNISLTYLEIYNEKIIDLLNTTATSELKIRDDPIYGTKIIGITSPVITSKDQLLQLIRKGDINRKTSATDFNARSSRSHSILQIKLNTIDLDKNTEQRATLSLCDLAGSERATSSAERRKEGAYINKSLLALSTVINKLSLSSFGSVSSNSLEHIPYRDSKLTRLLQPALSGSSLVSILCTIHLGSIGNNVTYNQSSITETYNTLRFAARAKDIIMNVKKNKSTVFGDSESLKLMEELKKTIENQKNEINMLRLNGGNSSSGDRLIEATLVDKDREISQLKIENKILNEKLEHLSRLTDIQKTETIILKNDALNDILGSGISNNLSQVMMANLEDFYKRVNYEMDEYKSYIGHLENQFRISCQQNIFDNANQSSASTKEITDKQLESVLKDQEEEIWHLKELLKDKDHVIRSLTKTSKLRRLVDSNSINAQDNSVSKEPIVRLAVSDSRADKENDTFNELREFNISPRRAHVVVETPDKDGTRFIV